HHSHGELSQVVARSAGILAMLVEAGGAEEIARRSRGTPRIANRLLRRVRDYAQVRGDGRVTDRVAGLALALFEVDERGLDKLDLSILSSLISKFQDGPVGMSTLAAAA